MKRIEDMWYVKYAPKSVKHIILPTPYKNYFNGVIAGNSIPNLLIESSRAGTGKTTLLHALASDLDVEFKFIPASVNGGIATLREDIRKYAMTAPMYGDHTKPKVVGLDEADGMSNAMQEGLRNVIDEFQGKCQFWMTCNYKEKIIDPLKDSRMQVFSFQMANPEFKREVFPQIVKRLQGVLQKEKVEYDPEAIDLLVDTCYPNIRNMYNLIEVYSKMYGKIDKGIVSFNIVDKKLINLYLDKNYGEIKKFIAENGYDFGVLYSTLFENLLPEIKEPRKYAETMHFLRQGVVDNGKSDEADKRIIFLDTTMQILEVL